MAVGWDLAPTRWDQYDLRRPVELSLHYGAQVTARGENLRRQVVTPTVEFTFTGTVSSPVTVRMSLAVLRRLVVAASPFLGPPRRARAVGVGGSGGSGGV